ncbi:MFS transporter [Streptomyces sp. NPDC046805]|uniref:MFS transporter n=1 Tax=Streptomyces sp. NPDC046805 TaxID=3155134 RepID=UPI0033E1BF8E
MTDVRPAAPSLSDRMERVPVLTRSHRTWMVLLGLLFFFDQSDINAFAFAAPAIREDWGMSVADVGLITAASFLGMFVGSIAGGRMADRYGRKRVIIGATFFYALFSLASAFAVSVADLAVYRVLTGVGLQAMTVVLLTYISEMYPSRLRGRVQALILAFSVLGIPAAAALARWVIPQGPDAWRWIFVAGSAGIVIALVALRALPESVRWNAANARGAASETVVARVEEQARAAIGGDLPPVEPLPAPAPASPRELLRPPLRKRLVVVSTFTMLALTVFYGFSAWMPTLLVENGFTTEQSLSFSSTVALAACPGALLAMLFIDRVERRTALTVIYSVSAALLLVFALVNSYPVLVAAGLLMVLASQAAGACGYTYLPEMFPTRLRALGVGIGNGAGRLAVVAGSFLIAFILGRFGDKAVFGCLVGAAVLAALVMGMFGERTRGRSLESLSDAASVAPAPRAVEGTAQGAH